MDVRITPDDIRAAAKETAEQLIRKVAFDRTTDHGGVSIRKFSARFGNGVIGMLGQVAASRATGLEITSKGVAIDYVDIAGIIEIRTTDWPNGYLTIYKNDEPTKMVMLVICADFPVFKLFIPILAKHGQRKDWWKANGDPPHYKVEQSHLFPLENIERLHAWIRRRLDDGSLQPSTAGQIGRHGIAIRQSPG